MPLVYYTIFLLLCDIYDNFAEPSTQSQTMIATIGVR